MKSKDLAEILLRDYSDKPKTETGKFIYDQTIAEMKNRMESRCHGSKTLEIADSLSVEVLRWGQSLMRYLPADFLLGADGKNKVFFMVILGVRDYFMETFGINPLEDKDKKTT